MATSAPQGAAIGNVRLLISEADRGQFAFINPWTVESRASRWHGYKTVRPCKTLDEALALYRFLGRTPLNRIRAT